jgi:hypothetical protein
MILRRKPSHGHTIAECMVAFAILVPVAVLVSKIGLQARQSIRASMLAAYAKMDLTNAREKIGAWNFDEVTLANIQSLPHAEYPDAQDSGQEWLAVVEEIQEPIPSKRVSLSLRWTPQRSPEPNEFGPLTFWVYKP